MTPILSDISLTRPFIGNAGDRKQWGIFQGKGLCRRAQMKRIKHAWAENDRRRAFCIGHAGEFVGGECRDAVSVCLLPGSA